MKNSLKSVLEYCWILLPAKDEFEHEYFVVIKLYIQYSSGYCSIVQLIVHVLPVKIVKFVRRMH